jgi:UPF0716 protein FxsA
MLPLLLLVFVVFPIVEIALLIAFGRQFGVAATVILVVGTGIVGVGVVRAQGIRTLQRVIQAARAGSFPGEELLEGAVTLAGGLLLVAPGLLSDLLGLAALLPGTRHLIKAWLRRTLRRRLRPGAVEARFTTE